MQDRTRPSMQSITRGRYAVSSMFLVNGFIIGSWAPQIPFMIPRHGLNEFSLGLMLLLFGVGAVTAMVWTGRLINQFGSRKITNFFAVFASLGLAAVILAPNIPLACIALFFTGACSGSMDVAMNANAVDVETRLGKAIMSASHGYWSVGGFIGSAIGGTVITHFGEETHAILVSTCALLVVLIAMKFVLQDAARGHSGEQKQKYEWPTGSAIYILGLMALFSMMPEGAVLDWAALYLSKELDASTSVSGFAFALFSGTMAIMRFAGDGLRDRYGAVATMRWSAVVAAIGIFAGGAAPNSWFAISAFAVAGLGIANTIPIIFSAGGNQPGISPAAGISIVSLMGYSGILLAPSLIGFVAQTIGFRITYITLAVFLMVIALNATRVLCADRK